MARPARMGLGYFPLDTDFLNDRKIRRLSQKFKNQGVMTYIATLCEIYGSKGYYIPFTSEVCFDIGFFLDMKENEVKEILLYCVEIHLFDREQLKQNGVLTSSGIQSRYYEIYRSCGRRKMPPITFDNLPIDKKDGDKDICSEQTPLSDAQMPLNGTETPVNSAKTVDLVAVTDVCSEQTPLNPAKTPTKGKGNKKGNKKQNLSTVNSEKSYEYPTLDTAGEAARRAELLRMAVEATQGR